MNYSYSEKLYIWLSNVFEGQPKAAVELISANGDIEELHYAVLKGNAVYPRSFDREKRERILQLANIALVDDYIAGLELNGVYPITYESAAYPERLKQIYVPPLVLYCRGKALDASCRLPFSIIGSRHCTEYGERMATLFGKVLAENGMTIVSGLAYGCDAYATKGALMAADNPLPTIAVLGQGVCVSKHDSTARLVNEIAERGILISEMLPYSKPAKNSYPLRNRIISGLSEGLLIVEAGEKSGTMITANAALEQGRMLFAIPGRITDRMSIGTNRLMKTGMAQAVYDPVDILEYFGINSVKSTIVSEMGNNDAILRKLDSERKNLYNMFLHGEKSFDSLCEMSGLSVETLNLYLTELEFSGLIKQLPGRVYTLN